MKKRILVIDDEPDFSRMLKLCLEAEGYYNVRAENDPDQALAAARDFSPDLVLLDVMMPRCSGCDLAARLGADPLLSDTPVLFLTALEPSGAPDDPSAGPDWLAGRDNLSKTVPVDAMIDQIEQILGRRRDARRQATRERDRRMLELKLQILRRNRMVCLQAQRDGFDLLISQAERELQGLRAGGSHAGPAGRRRLVASG